MKTSAEENKENVRKLMEKDKDDGLKLRKIYVFSFYTMKRFNPSHLCPLHI